MNRDVRRACRCGHEKGGSAAPPTVFYPPTTSPALSVFIWRPPPLSSLPVTRLRLSASACRLVWGSEERWTRNRAFFSLCAKWCSINTQGAIKQSRSRAEGRRRRGIVLLSSELGTFFRQRYFWRSCFKTGKVWTASCIWLLNVSPPKTATYNLSTLNAQIFEGPFIQRTLSLGNNSIFQILKFASKIHRWDVTAVSLRF